MANAEIITIGTEILLGELIDTNSRTIARCLRDISVDIYRKTSVGDNEARIAQAIQQALERSDIIITTGGLGPTIDDPTREAVARAVGVKTEFRPELWEQIQARFRRFNRLPTENNKRQAYVPQGALAIENPVGTAPAFIVEVGHRSIISLPGVPREMEFLLENQVVPYLRQRYKLQGLIKARILHTAGAGESQIDELISDLELLSNPTVGLAAHSGQVDIRITAKAESEEQADRMIAEVEETVRQRLGHWVYGSDLETLEEMALQALEEKGWSLAVVISSMTGELVKRLSEVQGPFLGAKVLTETPDPQELLAATRRYRQRSGADVGLGITIHAGSEKQDIHLALVTPEGDRQFHRPYGGPPKYAARWAVNNGLDLIRKIDDYLREGET